MEAAAARSSLLWINGAAPRYAPVAILHISPTLCQGSTLPGQQAAQRNLLARKSERRIEVVQEVELQEC